MKSVKLTFAFVLLFVTILASIIWLTRQPVAAAALPAPQRDLFLTGPIAGDPLDIALTYVAKQSAESQPLIITDQYTSQHNGVTHIYLQQQLNGIEIVNAIGNINIAADGSVINYHNQFVPGLTTRTATSEPQITASDAASVAAIQLGLTASEPFVQLEMARGITQPQLLSDGGVAQDPIAAKLVYVPQDTTLRLAWNLVINEVGGQHWWELQVDATTGDMLGQVDWVVDESWDYPNALSNPTNQPTIHQTNLSSPVTTTSPAYLVYPMPLIDAQDAGFTQTLIIDPADPLASPFGWHDTDGVLGPEYTDTRGNNVFAQEDGDRNNVGGYRPNGGPLLQFEHIFDPALPPDGGWNQSAAIVNLFYWNNALHDLFYAYGFDEAAGNFQQNNYGNGGHANDPLQADAQDGGGVNNANFATPPDGTSPRMQMFVWTAPPGFAVLSPAELAGIYRAASAGFGPSLNEQPASGTIVLADDGSDEPVDGDEGTVTDACQPLINADEVTGKIALVDRGNCFFTTKVRNAQDAGAIAVAVANNEDGETVFNMAGTDGSIVIPSVMISQNLGSSIKTTLPDAPVDVDLSGSDLANRDSDFDNLVIAHEFGHGVSKRLTGGPSNTNCLLNAEQMGEGISDFIGLLLTAKPDDTPEQPRGVGNYVAFQNVDEGGIRRYPYSTDMAISPLTFGDIGDQQIPHGVGTIWAAMLWELQWELIEEYGYDADLVYGQGGNNLALQLMLDGLKLQPCQPTFVEARDAILLADEVNNDGVNQCAVWRSFAKRGLGVSAESNQPDVSFEQEAFDVPLECEFLYTPEPIIDMCAGDTAQYAITVGSSFSVPLQLSHSPAPADSTIELAQTMFESVPDMTMLTITTTASISADSYTFVLTGTDALRSRTRHLTLNIGDTAPEATTPLTPTVDTLIPSLYPLLTWASVPQATQYKVEIATDAAFLNTIATITTRDTQLIAPRLNPVTHYYWRIQTLNGCGISDYSAISTFSTRAFVNLPIIGID